MALCLFALFVCLISRSQLCTSGVAFLAGLFGPRLAICGAPSRSSVRCAGSWLCPFICWSGVWSRFWQVVSTATGGLAGESFCRCLLLLGALWVFFRVALVEFVGRSVVPLGHCRGPGPVVPIGCLGSSSRVFPLSRSFSGSALRVCPFVFPLGFLLLLVGACCHLSFPLFVSRLLLIDSSFPWVLDVLFFIFFSSVALQQLVLSWAVSIREDPFLGASREQLAWLACFFLVLVLCFRCGFFPFGLPLGSLFFYSTFCWIVCCFPWVLFSCWCVLLVAGFAL